MRTHDGAVAALLLSGAVAVAHCGVPGDNSDDVGGMDFAGTPCEAIPVRCGIHCLGDWEDHPRPWCEVILVDDPVASCYDAVWARPYVFRRVGPDASAPVPSLPGWSFRGDGTEAVLLVYWSDSFANAGVVNHCFRSGGIAYVLAFPSGAVLFSARLEGNAWVWRRSLCDGDRCFDGSECPDRRTGVWRRCGTAVSVAYDQGMYFGWWSPTDPPWGFEGDVLDNAIHRFRLSTGEYLRSVDLPLE